jgi:hypothetical protein
LLSGANFFYRSNAVPAESRMKNNPLAVATFALLICAALLPGTGGHSGSATESIGRRLGSHRRGEGSLRSSLPELSRRIRRRGSRDRNTQVGRCRRHDLHEHSQWDSRIGNASVLSPLDRTNLADCKLHPKPLSIGERDRIQSRGPERGIPKPGRSSLRPKAFALHVTR